jgi:hypothetical protein
VKAAGAVDGTFGVHPMSNECLGITQEANERDNWPQDGDLEFTYSRSNSIISLAEMINLGIG